jgi:hypothetical protein
MKPTTRQPATEDARHTDERGRVQCNFRMTPEEAAEVRELARRNRLTVSQLIRTALRFFAAHNPLG